MFWNKTAISLDIDDRSIEAAELRRIGKKIKIVSLGRTVLDRGIVENGIIKQPGPLVSAIKETMAKARPSAISGRQVLLALPINQIYTAVVKLPDKTADVATALRAEARRAMPLPEDDLLFVSKSLGKTVEAETFLLVGVSRQLFLAWQDLAKRLKSPVESFDLQLYSLFRDLAVVDPGAPIVVVDLGAQTTNVLLFDGGTIQYAASLKLAGDHLTEAISEHYSLDFNIAEVKKIRLGLNRQLYPVMEPLLAEITLEIKRVLEYYKEKSGRLSAEVLLSGGSSRLKGLPYYFSDNLPVPVRLAQSVLAPGDYPEYLGAIGIGLRYLFPERWLNEPMISLSGDSRKKDNNLVIKEVPAIKEPISLAVESAGLGIKNPMFNNNDEQARKATEVKLLLAIVMIGVAMIGITWWYKNNNKTLKKYGDSLAAEDVAIQTVPFRIAVSLVANSRPTSSVSGRIIENQIAEAASYSLALESSIKQAQALLVEGESLWRDPLNEIVNQKNPRYPLTFRWLAYPDTKILGQLMEQLNSYSVNPPSFVGWTKDKLVKSDSASLVYLEGNLNVSITAPLNIYDPLVIGEVPSTSPNVSNADTVVTTTTEDVIAVEAEAVSTSSPELSKPVIAKAISVGDTITVGKTETGFLNVRATPAISGVLLTKINPGESYEVTALDAGWTQLKLTDGKLGWVASRYLVK